MRERANLDKARVIGPRNLDEQRTERSYELEGKVLSKMLLMRTVPSKSRSGLLERLIHPAVPSLSL